MTNSEKITKTDVIIMLLIVKIYLFPLSTLLLITIHLIIIDY